MFPSLKHKPCSVCSGADSFEAACYSGTPVGRRLISLIAAMAISRSTDSLPWLFYRACATCSAVYLALDVAR